LPKQMTPSQHHEDYFQNPVHLLQCIMYQLCQPSFNTHILVMSRQLGIGNW
jgi:hypothetical protein